MALDLILLPGGSKYTKFWIDDMRKALDLSFQYIYVPHYEHWNEVGDKNIKINDEAHNLSEYKKKTSNYGVVAYSEGIVVALKAIAEKKIDPQFAFFIGFPLEWMKAWKLDDEVRSWLRALIIPSLFYQARFDPNCSFEELKYIIESNKIRNTQIIQDFESYDSNYDDVLKLSMLIKRFAGI